MRPRLFYEFGPFRLYPAELVLLRDDNSVPLNRKSMATLLALIEQHGNVVTKESLLERVWKDTFVEEGVLSRNICDIRKALGDGNGKRYIETAPKIGYRFVHPVSVTDDSDRPNRFTSLAVLPFRLIAADDTNRYLGLALADAVIARLGGIRNMVIRPTSAVSRFATVPVDAATAAFELRVDAVLEGTIRTDQDRIRLIVHLVSASDNAPLWSSTFDCSATDLFELEDRVAVQVATALVLRLSGTERETIMRPSTRNADAYRLYLQARYYFAFVDSQDIYKPIRYLEQALQYDPDFVECYASIAHWYTAMTIHGAANPNEVVPKAKEFALKALRLNRRQQTARAALAFAIWHYDFEWREAETELRRMVRFAPNDPFARHILAMLLAETHRTDEAELHIAEAERLEPCSGAISSSGLVYWMAGQYDKAIERSRQALEMDPHCVRALWTMGLAEEAKGNFPNSVRWLRKANAMTGGSAMTRGALAHACAIGGRETEARRLAARMEADSESRYVSAGEIALVYIGLGEHDRAFELMFRAVEERSVCLVLTDVDPRLQPLRSDPRFGQLLNAIGLNPS